MLNEISPDTQHALDDQKSKGCSFKMDLMAAIQMENFQRKHSGRKYSVMQKQTPTDLSGTAVPQSLEIRLVDD